MIVNKTVSETSDSCKQNNGHECFHLQCSFKSCLCTNKKVRIFVKIVKMKSFDTLRLQPYDENELAKCTNEENRYVCSICVEICLTVEKLKLHYISGHGYKPTAYESSDDSSQSEKEVKKKEVVKTVAKPPKICEICQQPFKTAKILSRHIKHVHNKIKNFHCSVCSKQFTRKAALQVELGS